MNYYQDLKILNGRGFKALFNKSDLTLRLVPPELELFLEENIKNPNLETIPIIYNTVNTDDNIIKINTKKNKVSIDNKRSGNHALQRLTLNVSNQCNMACKYCYANQGTYYTSGMLMDKNTALNSINYIVKHFSNIKHVNFFGGEPTLNMPIIEMVCEYFYYLKSKNVLSYIPQFGLTSNAYFISKRIIELLQKYRFSITISIDGPKGIHDCLRVDHNNLGTYDKIEKNIIRIINSGITPEFECTYTLEHFRKGIDLVKLIDYFYEHFDCSTLHCPMVIGKSDSRLSVPINIAEKLYCDAIKYSIKNLQRGYEKSVSVAKRLINSLRIKKDICHYCPAGKSSLTINADGNIYACFMLMSDSRFKMGNINSIVEPQLYNEASVILKKCDKNINSDCQKCWILPLCFGCIAEDLDRSENDLQKSSILDKSELCDYKRKLVESFLLSTASLYLPEYRRT